VEQDHEEAGAPIKDAVPRLGESDSKLAQLAVDLRADRMLGRWGGGAEATLSLRYSST
jgi:hypothetical protein